MSVPRASRSLSAVACPALLAALLLAAAQLHSAELKRRSIAAFDRYVQQTEAQMAAKLDSQFLYPDSLSELERRAAYERLQHGEVVIAKLATVEDGKAISIPSALLHHWVGIIFVPGASLAQTLAVAQNYDNREIIYQPDVVRSRLLARDGDQFKVFLRFYKKGFTTVVLNTEYDITYRQLDSHRVLCTSYSTRIAEVADPENPDGPELPPGKEHGYLWRLYTYWRFQQKDGGVYIQCQAVSLTRGIPFGLGWLLGPLVKSIPRQALKNTLAQTRHAILSQPHPAAP